MIVVDLTLRHAGYIADATRTFVLGSATKEMKEVYDIVKGAQKIGLDTANAGMTCGQVDAGCRNLIRDHGYEKQFIHSTGHGIGLDVHEPPWIKMKNDEELRANMTVTVEPGIYKENKFGVRIEDSIIVNNGKPQSTQQVHKRSSYSKMKSKKRQRQYWRMDQKEVHNGSCYLGYLCPCICPILH